VRTRAAWSAGARAGARPTLRARAVATVAGERPAGTRPVAGGVRRVRPAAGVTGEVRRVRSVAGRVGAARWPRAAVLVAAVVAGGVLLPAGPAGAAACSGSGGVTVVVDFGSLGGGIQVGCAVGDPASGLAALHAAGFGTTGTRKDGPGFVCRINGAPASDPCVVTPPANAYWSYWHAPRGGAWAYSSAGAAGYNPAAGSVEGWAFGAGARPRIAPPAAPAPPPPAPTTTTKAPKPTTQAPAPPPRTTAAPPGGGGTQPQPGGGNQPGGGQSGGSRPGAGNPSGGSRPGATAGPGPSRSGAPSGPGTPTAAGATSGAAPSTVGGEATEAPPPTTDPSPLAEPPADGGGGPPVLPFVLGAVVIAALGGTAFAIDRRRRAG
jgi:hypothetical protein